VGAGIWTTVAAGAAAGGTAGGVSAGIARMWEERYRDAIHEGQMIAGVHTSDAARAERAAAVLARQGPDRVDRFDSEGRPVG
jgi:hypothetical protein